MSPYLPVTPRQIADEAIAAALFGAGREETARVIADLTGISLADARASGNGRRGAAGRPYAGHRSGQLIA